MQDGDRLLALRGVGTLDWREALPGTTRALRGVAAAA